MKIGLLANSQELHATLDHAPWRIAIAAHDPVGQGAVIDTDTDRRMMALTDLEERDKALPDLLDLGGILLVRIFQLAEGLDLIHVVAGVDPHLLHLLRRGVGCPGIEMDIGDQRGREALLVQQPANDTQVACLPLALRRETHVLGSRLDHADSLGDRSLGIHRGDVGHRLDPDRIIASQRRVPDMGNRRAATGIIEIIHNVAILNERRRDTRRHVSDNYFLNLINSSYT